MNSDELAAIREAISDTTSPYTHSDSDIEQIYDLVHSRHLVIAHFLLSDAIALAEPTAPTPPTLDSPPSTDPAPAAPTLTAPPEKTTSLALQKWQNQVSGDKYLADLETRKWESTTNTDLTKWREKCSNQLNQYSQEISAYRAKQMIMQTKLELRRAHAQIYLDLAKDGMV